jgi:hypothetical protein
LTAIDTAEPTPPHAPFVVVYSAADAAGRTAARVTRNVTVVSPCAAPSYLCPPPSAACARCGGGNGGGGDASCVCLSALDELTGDADVVLEAYEPPVDTTPPVLTVRLGVDGSYARTPSGVVVVVHTVRLPSVTVRIMGVRVLVLAPVTID